MSTLIPKGKRFYRFTNPLPCKYLRPPYYSVVNGQGAAQSSRGSRFAMPLVPTVYLATSLATCLAERIFYFQSEFLATLDVAHSIGTGTVPAITEIETLIWEVTFKVDFQVEELTSDTASSYGVYPALLLNPSQDYKHLQHRRVHIQSNFKGDGILAPSARCQKHGKILVLYNDVSTHVQDLQQQPHAIRLINEAGKPLLANALGTEVPSYTEAQIRKLPKGLWKTMSINR